MTFVKVSMVWYMYSTSIQWRMHVPVLTDCRMLDSCVVFLYMTFLLLVLCISECVDRYVEEGTGSVEDCEQWRAHGKCHPDHSSFAWMKKFCKKTCDLCGRLMSLVSTAAVVGVVLIAAVVVVVIAAADVFVTFLLIVVRAAPEVVVTVSVIL